MSIAIDLGRAADYTVLLSSNLKFELCGKPGSQNLIALISFVLDCNYRSHRNKPFI